MIRLPLLCLIFALAGCADRNPPLRGLQSLDEAQKAADRLLIDASPETAWSSMDRAGISVEKQQAYWKFWSDGWKKAKVRQHHKWTRVMTLAEYLEFIKETRKEWSEQLREKEDTWNHQPEKIFVYYFEMKEEKTSASAHFSLGAFRRDGLWYFSAQN